MLLVVFATDWVADTILVVARVGTFCLSGETIMLEVFRVDTFSLFRDSAVLVLIGSVETGTDAQLRDDWRLETFGADWTDSLETVSCK